MTAWRGGRRLGSAAASALALCLAGCGPEADPPQTSCPYPAKAMIAAQLFFGRDIPGREPVTEAEWSEFVSQTLAQQFPDGFTVLDAAGNWRDGKTGKAISEPSKIVLIAADSAPDMDRRLDAVIAAYRSRFHQQAVGMLRSTACGAF